MNICWNIGLIERVMMTEIIGSKKSISINRVIATVLVFSMLFNRLVPIEVMASVTLVLSIILLIVNGINFQLSSFIVGTIIFIHGIINVLVGNNTMLLFSAQLIGVFSAFIAYQVLFENVPFDFLVRLYLRIAKFSVLLIFVQIFAYFAGLTFIWKLPPGYGATPGIGQLGFLRGYALFREPAEAAMYLAPLLCIAICTLLGYSNKYLNKTWSLLTIIAFILTQSTKGYICIAIVIVFLYLDRIFSLRNILLLVFGALIIAFLFNASPDFQERIISTISFQNGRNIQENFNLSSAVSYTNQQISFHTFKESHFLGTGLGSYRLDFDKYRWLFPFYGVGDYLNREDAYSSFFRIIAETGIFGIVIIVRGLFKYKIWKYGSKNRELFVLNTSAFLFILMKLLSDGNYLNAGTFFFVFLYVYSFYQKGNDLTND